MKPIGILGGTFDPIHFGHLRSGLEVYESLEFEHIRLIPCGVPPHRELPIASNEQRLAMMRLAVEDNTKLIVDQRELQREGPSYTVDTLLELRQEFPDTPLCLIIGSDAFLGLDSWHQWKKIPQLAHLVVVHRPGWTLSDIPAQNNSISKPIAQLLSKRHILEANRLSEQPAGLILFYEVTQMGISSTRIRKLIGLGKSPRYLLPDGVLTYIRQEGIYSPSKE